MKIMNTPVSFESAKLLKEKGFDIPCREGWVKYLTSFTGETKIPDDESNLVMDRLGNNHLIERPTIAEVVMWLYEKHGVWISSDIVKSNTSINIHFKYKINGETIDFINIYSSPIKAYEAAIEYCLTRLNFTQVV